LTSAYFADSSALVKLYADEPGAETVRSVGLLVASQLARVEVPAAIWRKHRIGELPAAAAGVLVAAFEADYFGTDGEPPRFSVVKATAHILDQAARLVAAHGLRPYDAVQLASACVVNAAVPEGVAFLAFDKALCSAAAAEGLELPPASS
jgi:predicted nucleic acid-binding protein